MQNEPTAVWAGSVRECGPIASHVPADRDHRASGKPTAGGDKTNPIEPKETKPKTLALRWKCGWGAQPSDHGRRNEPIAVVGEKKKAPKIGGVGEPETIGPDQGSVTVTSRPSAARVDVVVRVWPSAEVTAIS